MDRVFVRFGKADAQALCFFMDEEGIRSASCAAVVLAFIFVIPVRTIPHSAIESISDKNGVLTLRIDKSKSDIPKALRIFARSHCFFSGFTKEKKECVKAELDRFMKSRNRAQ